MGSHRAGVYKRVEYSGLSKLIGLMTGDEKHSTSATSTLDVPGIRARLADWLKQGATA